MLRWYKKILAPHLLGMVLAVPPGGCFYVMSLLRSVVFIDGQNLYHLAKEAWHVPGQSDVYSYPSYDVEKLAAELVNKEPGRALHQIRFYTGVPDPRLGQNQQFWHLFWARKTRILRNRGIFVYLGRVGAGEQEKGVDMSIAIDLIRLTYEKQYEVAVIVSQDTDFGPAVKLAKQIAAGQKRCLTFESCFPYESGRINKRGIPGTTWVHIDQQLYNFCIDPVDYRAIRI